MITAIQISTVERSNVRSTQWCTTNELLFLSFSFSLSSFRSLDYEMSQKLDEIFEKRITFSLHPLKNTVGKSFLERYYFRSIRATCRTMHKRRIARHRRDVTHFSGKYQGDILRWESTKLAKAMVNKRDRANSSSYLRETEN